MSEPYINAIDYASPERNHVTVQTALDAAAARGGGTVVIGEGDWVFGGTCIIKENTRLIMYGARITCDDAGRSLFRNYDSSQPQPAKYSGHGNITVEGGMLDMRGHVNDVAGNCMTFAHASDIAVRDVQIRNVSSYHAIEPHAVQNMTIADCGFYGWRNWLGTDYDWREAIQVDSVNLDGDDGTPVDDLTVTRCRFGPSTECGSWGTAIGSHTNGTAVHRGVKILHCTISDTLVYGVRAHSWSDFMISHTEFDHVSGHAVLVEPARNLPGHAAIVDRNVITAVGVNGIRFKAEAADRFSDILVQGNLIRYSGSNALLFADVDWGTVQGNTVRSTDANYGMQIGIGDGATATGLLVADNQIFDSRKQGFRMNSAQKCHLTGNRVRAGTGGVNAGGTNTGSVVVGNFFDGNGWSASEAMAGSYTGVTTVYTGNSSIPGDNII